MSGKSQAASNEQVARAVTAWQDSAAAGKAPPLRFPVGTPVERFALATIRWWRESLYL